MPEAEMNVDPVDPELAHPPEGAEPVDMLETGPMLRSFVSGDPRGARLRIRYFRRSADGALLGNVWFGPDAQGPPGHAHGGSMAAVLDEAMGASAWLAGHAVVAAQITVQFRRMLPLGTIARLEAWVDVVNGRKVTTRGRLVDDRGEAFAEGEGLFIQLGHDRFSALASAAAKTPEDDRTR
jgi:acyl-coenzyme A thioesterase PaaI-like protein